MFVRYRFPFNPQWREKFCAGTLSARWRKQYPHLFTAHDKKLADNQPAYHFYEWLGSVLLHESTGYHTCLKWCCAGPHAGKSQRFRRLAGADIADEIIDWTGGHPDILAYSSDEQDWFLCEIKGLHDEIRPNQIAAAKSLYRLTKRRVRLLDFQAMNRG